MSKPTVCAIEDCNKNALTRGWCPKHYNRFLLYGDPMKLSRRRSRTPMERFEDYSLATDGGCIEWQGFKQRGYGKFQVNYRSVSAHRWIWEQHNGPIPDGLIIRHTCDNPPCVNPEHMELGTNMDNARDMVERSRSLIGSTNPESKLDEDKVRQILRDLQRGSVTQKALAQKYCVTPGAIAHIVHGRSWKHVRLEDAA